MMGIGVVFAGAIVVVFGNCFMRRQALQPHLVIVQQPVCRIVYENRSGNVHRIHQAKAFLNPALA